MWATYKRRNKAYTKVVAGLHSLGVRVTRLTRLTIKLVQKLGWIFTKQVDKPILAL